MNRRTFMQETATAAFGIMAPGAALMRAQAAPSIPIGLGLVTVLPQLMKDFEGSLRQIAEIGYREVESMGAFGREPVEVRDMFAKHGLVSPSQLLAPRAQFPLFQGWLEGKVPVAKLVEEHNKTVLLDVIERDMHEAIPIAKMLGQKYIVCVGLPEPSLASRQAIDDVIKAFNLAGDLCAKEGLTFVFHNHTAELMPVGADIPFDLFLRHTDPEKVKMEMDFSNASHANIDPIVYLEKHPNRFRLCHLRDNGPQAEASEIGTGTLDFRRFFEVASKTGMEHYFVEYLMLPDPFKSIRTARKLLQSMI